MLKRISSAALAAISLCAFAHAGTGQNYQTNDPMWESKNNIYMSDNDLLANPPVMTKGNVSFGDMEWNVRHQAHWLCGSDAYDFLSMIQQAPSDVSNALILALYNARWETNIARHDMVAQQVGAYEQLVMAAPTGYTPFYPQTALSTTTTTTQITSITPAAPGSVETATTTTITDTGPTIVVPTMTVTPALTAYVVPADYSDIDNRPLRFMFTNPKHPDINYYDALHIIDRELTQSEATEVNSWWDDTATDREKDVIVHFLKKDAWLLTVPVYPSTLTHTSF